MACASTAHETMLSEGNASSASWRGSGKRDRLSLISLLFSIVSRRGQQEVADGQVDHLNETRIKNVLHDAKLEGIQKRSTGVGSSLRILAFVLRFTPARCIADSGDEYSIVRVLQHFCNSQSNSNFNSPAKGQFRIAILPLYQFYCNTVSDSGSLLRSR